MRPASPATSTAAGELSAAATPSTRLAVLTIPNTNVGGYENTGWDLVFNALGAVVAAVAIALADRGTAQPSTPPPA